jgi:ATP-dependent exoDNAse (exonuclease V) alpha subunit
LPAEEDLRDELAGTEGLEPNEGQSAVKAMLESGRKGVVVLSGGPGTGKTFLTRHLLHKWRQEGRALVVSATTGAAATRISRGAQTVHSAFNIPLDGMYLGSLQQYDATFQRLKQAEIVIIDEMSMLSAPILNLVLFRLQQCGGYRDVQSMLKEKLIVLVGDHAQVRGAAALRMVVERCTY